MEEIDLSEIEGFEWDEGNLTKNKEKHNVDYKECEEVFSNQPFYFPDRKHSQNEQRWLVYGVTNTGRYLTCVFTIREKLIRIISAREQNKKEKKVYKNHINNLNTNI